MPTIWELLNMPAPTAEVTTSKNKAHTNKSRLQKAKDRKDDEYYTRFYDVESELSRFKSQLHGKCIYMPCDDPRESAFWEYLHNNFKELGLRRIIASFKSNTDESPFVMSYYGGNDHDLTAGTVKQLIGNGDFRSDELSQYFYEADIIITNPPFSLFHDFIAKIQQFNKDFLIIGNMNACTYKELFPLLRDNKVRLGYKYCDWHKMYFRLGKRGDFDTEKKRVEDLEVRGSSSVLFVPSSETCTKAKPGGLRASFSVNEYGHTFALVTAWWYTTLNVIAEPYDFDKMPHYDPKLYPKYDNYDAIEVGKLKDVPCDYFGCMGVPITFFEELDRSVFKVIDKIRPSINGKQTYYRLLVKRIDVDPKQA